MNLLYIHIPEQNESWFIGTFVAAFIVLLAIFWADGIRRKQSPLALGVVALSLVLFFFIGMKAGVQSSGSAMLSFFVTHPQAMVIGKSGALGLLIAVLGLLVVVAYLKLPPRILDSFAYALPVAAMLQRVGCLFNGCCYGIPSNAPWALVNNQGSPLWHQQVLEHVIVPSAAMSHPAHPVPVYYMLAGLFTIAVLKLVHKRVKGDGNLALLSFLLLVASRFVVEFYRAPSTLNFLGNHMGGLMLIQWCMIGIIVGGASLFVARFRHAHASVQGNAPLSVKRVWWLMAAFAGLGIFYVRAFTPMERVVLLFFFAPPAAILLNGLSFQLFQHKRVIVYLSMAAFLLFSMTQSTDTTRHGRQILERFVTIDGSYATGNINYQYYSGSTEGCEAPTKYNSKLDYSGFSGGLRFGTAYEGARYNETLLRLHVFGGNETVNQIDQHHRGIGTFAIGNRYFWPNAALGLGLNIGTVPNDKGYENQLMPYVALQLGPQKYFYFEGGIGDFTLNPIPVAVTHAGIGTHFGRSDDAGARVGINQQGFYTQLNIPVTKLLLVNIQYMKGPNDRLDDFNYYQFGLSYRFTQSK